MKNSKTKQVIEYLEKGSSLTKKECFEVFSYWNLSDLILKLRDKHGYDYVTTTMKKTSSGCEYAEYKLS